MPEITKADRQKPLCYDPKGDKFIYYDELISGKEKVVPLEKLNHEQLKRLILERQRAGPDYTVQIMSGAKYSRDDVIKEITKETDFGKMTIEAEVSYLSELLKQIEEALSKDC